MFMLMKNEAGKKPALFDSWARDLFPTDLWDTGYRYPAVDIYEQEGLVHIDAEVPGMTRENLTVGVEDGVLTISGELKQEEEDSGKNYFRTERKYGTFKRSFTLGENVDEESVTARFENGILKVSIPVRKPQKPEPRSIEIK